MNSKLAKAIRREAGYHPTDARKYLRVEKKGLKGPVSHIVLDPESSRAKYRALKKEYR